ncbi:T9SS type A sorting domain-containing protein [Flavobacterium cerinum]|uniref:T9SS type A sorting domain-containing protein n=1 Tax=Flavobacterium cerinum TaxID=2502784 RepID=A0ABY5IMY8_9FLAO|nr:T9SS type A sorting domain-containing protein [Flavobacterium cerinum]UUC44155.1 T9SS type A sorting domain-containing protein [Flavobacterium cerinum]
MSYSFMCRLYCLFLLLACPLHSFSQDILWEKSYGGKHAEFLADVLPTPDYGFLLVGSSLSDKNGNKQMASSGNFDYWLWKMDEHGSPEWQKSFGGSGMDFLQNVQLTSDGGFILGGTSLSSKGEQKKEDSRGQQDLWIIKLDAKGSEQWQRTIGGSGQEELACIRRTKDGGYIVGGSSASGKSGDKTEDNYGNLDYWIIKLSSDGKIEWQKTYGGKGLDQLRTVEQTLDEGYIIGGYSNSPASGNKQSDNMGAGDYWILKTDKNGLVQWQRTLGGDGDDNLTALIQCQTGGYLLGGSSNSNPSRDKSRANGKGTDFWLMRLDQDGQTIWQETYNYGKTDLLTSIIENPDHTFLIGGHAATEVGDGKKDKKDINDYIALKINDKGEELWSKTVGSDGEDILSRLVETRDGGYLLAGTSKGTASRDKNGSHGGSDFWVVKLKDRYKKELDKPAIEALPNPAQQFTNIIVDYDFETGTASVFDLAGRQLQQFAIGSRTVPVDLSTYPEGIYIVEIRTNVQNNSVKVIKGIQPK